MSVWDAEVSPLSFLQPVTALTKRKLVMRDVRERGRDVEGIVKQWFTYVKPSYKHYVEPQRAVSGKLAILSRSDISNRSSRHHHSPWN